MGRAFEYRKARKMKRWGSMARTFTKIGKEIAIAIKSAGPDPAANSRLRVLMQNAKNASMPKENIERIIAKAKIHPVGDPLARLRPPINSSPVRQHKTCDLSDFAQSVDSPVILIHRFEILYFRDHLGRQKLDVIQVGRMYERAILSGQDLIINPVFIH